VISSTTTVNPDQGSQQGSPFNAGTLATNPQSRETSPAGAGAAHENRPPFYSLTYIIRKS
jgi:microcystin-dependent protein